MTPIALWLRLPKGIRFPLHAGLLLVRALPRVWVEVSTSNPAIIWLVSAMVVPCLLLAPLLIASFVAQYWQTIGIAVSAMYLALALTSFCTAGRPEI